MPSISGGGGYIPQPLQPQRPIQQAAPAQAEKAQASLAPKDTVRLQSGPTQTTLTSQVAQRLTSDSTRAQIQQLIQTAQPQPPADKPQLQMMERPAMSSALADTLANVHVPEQQNAQQQQPQQPGLNQQAQQAAGQYQTSTFVRSREHTEDSSARNAHQSGKRVKKQDQEGEFASLEDFGGSGGMSGDQSGQDQRSDSQKKKQILTAEEKRKAPPGAPVSLQKPAPPKPTTKPGMTGMMKAATGPIQTPPKPPAPKPSVQRVQPPLSQQPKPAPPKKPTDEWTF